MKKFLNRLLPWFLPLMAVGLFVACDSSAPVVKTPPSPVGGKVFASAEEAVELAGGMMRDHQWTTLSEYYDLTDSKIPIEELTQGTFFHGPRTEGMQHPSGASRYKHPFPPGCRFLRTETTDREDTLKVIVSLEIDQGLDVPQRMLAAFLLRKQADGTGWKILPQKVDP